MGDYIPDAPVNDEARKRNGNLPGQGGIFNLVNMHLYHYAGNNPVKYVDPDGRDTFVATFNRNANTITAVYTNSTTGQTTAYQWSVSNNVRNEINNQRSRPNARTIPSSGESNWYFPRSFPAGRWNIFRSNHNPSDPASGSVFIPTNAHQEVPVYGPVSSPMPEPNTEGRYIPTEMQDDIGYGLHYSEGNTQGCIGFGSQADANAFADLSDQALNSSNGSSVLIVE
jgi:hypothetical protein